MSNDKSAGAAVISVVQRPWFQTLCRAVCRLFICLWHGRCRMSTSSHRDIEMRTVFYSEKYRRICCLSSPPTKSRPLFTHIEGSRDGMEELQDAIEDVQYLQAVNSKDSGPSPTEPWPFPSEKELEEVNAERLTKDGKCYSLERICSSVLGLYLVRPTWSNLNRRFLLRRYSYRFESFR